MRHFLSELEELKSHLLEMGGLVELAIKGSLRSLLDRSSAEAEKVLKGEAKINQFEIDNDLTATRLLALNQPVARDLRFITASIKITKDLERMGDLASNIAKSAISLASAAPFDPSLEIPELAKMVEEMVSRCLQSFLERDEEMAYEVIKSDDAVDDLKNVIFRRLVSQIETEPANAAQKVDLILILHSLERIADHATNIAEDVLFFINGIDVRRAG